MFLCWCLGRLIIFGFHARIYFGLVPNDAGEICRHLCKTAHTLVPSCTHVIEKMTGILCVVLQYVRTRPFGVRLCTGMHTCTLCSIDSIEHGQHLYVVLCRLT